MRWFGAAEEEEVCYCGGIEVTEGVREGVVA